MDTVSVSPKFQVVIPRRIREALGLKTLWGGRQGWSKIAAGDKPGSA